MIVTRAAVLAGGAALLFPARPAAAADLVKIRVSVVPITDAAPFFAAAQEGYFTEVGLEATSYGESSGVVGVPGLVAGSYDLVYSSIPTVFLAIQQGIDLRIVAMGSISGPPDVAALLVRKGENLHGGKDVEGKTIGVNDGVGVQSLYARAWVRVTGGDPDKVTFRAVPSPQMVDALRGKFVDAIFPIEPFLSAALADPAFELMGSPFSQVQPRPRTAAWVVTGDFAQKHPDVIRKFLTALDKGARWVNANVGKDPFFRLVANYTKLDPARVAALKMRPARTDVEVARLRQMADLMRENKMLTTTLDPATKVFVR
jgi:NitT/TauT family transport system substrate-binding protein